jgi:5'-methylthioadenosine phosphorylase
VTIEGPRFSSRAESHFFRLLDADLINMTIGTECGPLHTPARVILAAPASRAQTPS